MTAAGYWNTWNWTRITFLRTRLYWIFVVETKIKSLIVRHATRPGCFVSISDPGRTYRLIIFTRGCEPRNESKIRFTIQRLQVLTRVFGLGAVRQPGPGFPRLEIRPCRYRFFAVFPRFFFFTRVFRHELPHETAREYYFIGPFLLIYNARSSRGNGRAGTDTRCFGGAAAAAKSSGNPVGNARANADSVRFVCAQPFSSRAVF